MGLKYPTTFKCVQTQCVQNISKLILIFDLVFQMLSIQRRSGKNKYNRQLLLQRKLDNRTRSRNTNLWHNLKWNYGWDRANTEVDLSRWCLQTVTRCFEFIFSPPSGVWAQSWWTQRSTSPRPRWSPSHQVRPGVWQRKNSYQREITQNTWCHFCWCGDQQMHNSFFFRPSCVHGHAGSHISQHSRGLLVVQVRGVWVTPCIQSLYFQVRVQLGGVAGVLKPASWDCVGVPSGLWKF